MSVVVTVTQHFRPFARQASILVKVRLGLQLCDRPRVRRSVSNARVVARQNWMMYIKFQQKMTTGYQVRES